MSANFIDLIRSDIRAPDRNVKGLAIMMMYRIGHCLVTGPRVLKPFALLYGVFYKIITEMLFGVDISPRCHLGRAVRIFHGYGLVIHCAVHVGDNVILRQGVTIGEKATGSGAVPTIGNGVDIGASSIILGKINVGDGAVIGAGSIVVKDVPPMAVVAGNPARVIRIRDS